jgi:hypothetical protein
MLKTVAGIYDQGEIKLQEKPDDIPSKTQVIVTFLTNNYHIKTVIEESSSLKEYHDLDDLAGTWTEEDEAEFLQNTSHFNQIDAKLW